MTTNFLRLTSLLALFLLTACGGGSGGAGTSGFGGSSGGTGSVGTATSLVLTLSAGTIANNGSQTVVATASALDANRNIVAGIPVTIATDTGVVTPSGTVTGTNGTLTATIGIGSNQTIRTMTITAVSGTLSQAAQLKVVDASNSNLTPAPTLSVALSSSSLTSASPITVTLSLRDTSGNAVANGVVTLTTLRGNLATLSPASVLTNASGLATATLRSAAAGVDGADQVIATAAVNAVQTQGTAAFTVSATDTPTIAISPASSTLRFSTAPTILTAHVSAASGAALANQLVTFAAANGLVRLSAGTALTGPSGDATVAVSPLTSSTAGAEIVTATSSVSGRTLQVQASLQVTPESPSIATTISGSSISAASPATLTATARGVSGALLPNTVVSFSSLANLATFTPATLLTDINGQAATVVSPKTASASGADTLVASISSQGVTATSQTVVQFNSGVPSGTPTLSLVLSPSNSLSAASPITATATLLDAQGRGAPSQVVAFNVVRGLATTNIATALTNAAGQALVVMSPTSSASAGADQISASVTYGGVALQSTMGFQVQATAVTLGAFTSAVPPPLSLSAYGQTTLSLVVNGASVTSPVNIGITSSCVAQGKATLSPATITATTSPITIQYRDNGCGALQASDQLQAVVTSSGLLQTLSLPITAPYGSSLAFISATPSQIYLKGSGLGESAIVSFQVNDAAGNPLPNRVVELRLLTGAGGVTMEGRPVEATNSISPFTQTSNALGQVSARVNSGTLPTPVRVQAHLVPSASENSSISTVSSNLSVAVGLPSQLNFSFSQGTKNIEGYSIDGTPNTYQIIAADRSGNPVPAGTSINFVTEGGQIEAVKQTQIVNGIARTTANFVSSEPRPVDGRVTITAYALGEESFLDLNGDNVWNAKTYRVNADGSQGTEILDGNGNSVPEPFQDLGNVFKDRNFDGLFDPAFDEYIPLTINNGKTCVTPIPLLALDASIPSAPGTCDGVWSGAGQVYVRRAAETVFSTSAARPLWANTSGLDAGCRKITMQVGPLPTQLQTFTLVGGDTWYGGASGTLVMIAGDANPGSASQNLSPRLNPMAAGTVISAATSSPGLTTAVGGGSPVASTTEASVTSIAYAFTPPASAGVIFVTFTSPSGFGTSVAVNVTIGSRSSSCPSP